MPHALLILKIPAACSRLHETGKKPTTTPACPRAAADLSSAHRRADLELHPSTDPSADGPIRLDTELTWNHPDPTGDEWRLSLTTHFGTENEGKPAPYSGKVQIMSRFQIDPKLAKTKATRLIQDQGAGILFTATRELLIQLTSRSLHGEFVLPGVGFVKGEPELKIKRKAVGA